VGTVVDDRMNQMFTVGFNERLDRHGDFSRRGKGLMTVPY
jgi:hypothetical protein